MYCNFLQRTETGAVKIHYKFVFECELIRNEPLKNLLHLNWQQVNGKKRVPSLILFACMGIAWKPKENPCSMWALNQFCTVVQILGLLKLAVLSFLEKGNVQWLRCPYILQEPQDLRVRNSQFPLCLLFPRQRLQYCGNRNRKIISGNFRQRFPPH